MNKKTYSAFKTQSLTFFFIFFSLLPCFQGVQGQSNDSAKLSPQVPESGPSLKFDFPGLKIGIAEYKEGPTGCTVFYFPEGATCALDLAGGSPGTFLPGDGYVDAICYSGGSLYGLESASGVAAELFAIRKYSTDWQKIALVRGAVLFDFTARSNGIYPDKELGRIALRNAKEGLFLLGSRGAGISATVGKSISLEHAESGGQGAAFQQIGPTKIAVFTIVNAVGALVNRQGKVVRGHYDPKTKKRYSIQEKLDQLYEVKKNNTTLTLVVTNQILTLSQLKQLARQVHSSMSRSIQPFQTLTDGDLLYFVTTNAVENNAMTPLSLGVFAEELAWDAVLNCFPK